MLYCGCPASFLGFCWYQTYSKARFDPCAHMWYMHVYMFACAHALWRHSCERLEVDLSLFCNHSPLYFSRQSLPLSLGLPARLASELQGSSCLYSPATGAWTRYCHPWFFMDSGDPNSSRHACMPSTLPTKPLSPSPHRPHPPSKSRAGTRRSALADQ